MSVVARDLVKEPLGVDEVRTLVDEAGGLDAVLSIKSPAYRARVGRVADRGEWMLQMVEEPRLIRRPILLTDRGASVGFDPARWQELLA